MNKRKKVFVKSEDNFKNYTFINDNYETNEVFSLDSVIRMMKDEFDIECNKEEAESIVDGARQFAAFTDRFKIEKFYIDDEIHYKIVCLE